MGDLVIVLVMGRGFGGLGREGSNEMRKEERGRERKRKVGFRGREEVGFRV